MLAFALFFRGVEGHKPSIAGLTVLASADLAHHLVIILAPQKKSEEEMWASCEATQATEASKNAQRATKTVKH